MRQLSEAIETFSAAAERLDEAVLRAARRAEARADGAEAQGDVIVRLRSEIETLKQALETAQDAAPRQDAFGARDERVAPSRAAG